MITEEFEDVSYWDEERGPFYIFDREPRLNRFVNYKFLLKTLK